MAKAFTQLKTKQDLDDKLTFGKWSGFTIKEICRADPDYLHWCLNQCNLLFVSTEVLNWLDFCTLQIKTERNIEKAKIKQYYQDIHSDQDDWWEDVPF